MTTGMALTALYYLLLIGVAFHALLRGGVPERVGAALNVGASLLTLAVIPPLHVRWRSVDLPTFAIDAAVAAGFFVIARRSDRFWPVWCLGFAIANLFVHFARFAVQDEVPLAYADGSVAWAYLALVALAVGTSREAGVVAGPRLADRVAMKLQSLLASGETNEERQ
jgi:hypothetical protein